MAKIAIDEVEVLRFFETESLDKATVLFNIVSDKMRTRLNGDQATPPLAAHGKRRSKIAKLPGAEVAEPTPAAS